MKKTNGFKNGDEIKAFFEEVANKLGIKRDSLAEILGVSTSSFYGYITRHEIPDKHFDKLIKCYESGSTITGPISSLGPQALEQFSLDMLLAEIEKRGWLVELKRNVNK